MRGWGGGLAPFPLPALSIPLNGHRQGGWHGAGHGTSTVCLSSVTRDSLKWVRRGVARCHSRGQIFPIRAIMGMGGAGGAKDTQGRGQGPGPHVVVVVSLGRRKKLAASKLHFLEKECASPRACVFISPGGTGSPAAGPWLPLALPCPVPQLQRVARPAAVSCPGNEPKGFGCSGSDSLPPATLPFLCLLQVNAQVPGHLRCSQIFLRLGWPFSVPSLALTTPPPRPL